MKNFYDKNKIGKIHIDNFNDCIKMIKRYKPSSKAVHKHLDDLQKKQDNGVLKEHVSNALDKFLDKTNGGNDLPW